MALSYEIRDGKAAWGGRLLRNWVPLVVDKIVQESSMTAKPPDSPDRITQT